MLSVARENHVYHYISLLYHCQLHIVDNELGACRLPQNHMDLGFQKPNRTVRQIPIFSQIILSQNSDFSEFSNVPTFSAE